MTRNSMHRPKPYSGTYGPVQKPGFIHFRSGLRLEKKRRKISSITQPAVEPTKNKNANARGRFIFALPLSLWNEYKNYTFFITEFSIDNQARIMSKQLGFILYRVLFGDLTDDSARVPANIFSVSFIFPASEIALNRTYYTSIRGIEQEKSRSAAGAACRQDRHEKLRYREVQIHKELSNSEVLRKNDKSH